MIEIPASFADGKAISEGPRGRAWIAELPAVVDELLRRWFCTPVGPVMHGQVGIVVPVHNTRHSRRSGRSPRDPRPAIAPALRRWLAVDPKTYVGDPAHEALNVIRSPRFDSLLRSSNIQSGIFRHLDIYCRAAQLDTERTRRWIQFGAVREAMWGRRHNDPDWLVQATDQLAETLT